ncbi:amidase [Nemania abortiva]|nr:amidase [Nemania abortiva]
MATAAPAKDITVLRGNVPAVFQMNNLNSFNLSEVTITKLQDHLGSKHFTSEQYVSLCLERIRQIDPYLEAVMEINPDALHIARNLDGERERGVIRGPLHGIPVLVKDNIATKDKMQTACGSWALLGSIVPRDAFVVSQLRKGGAIIIGHANLTEWASLRSTWYSDGYSPRRGQVRNPYNLSCSPFGSSGGSAVAVSSNMVPLAFATETDGSIAGPAQINGLVGIKPTPGLTSRKGVIPTSESMDTVGLFGRTVADATIGLDTIVGPDPADPLSVSDDVRREAQGLASQYTDVGKYRIAPNGKWDWELGGPAQSEFTIIKTEAYNSLNSYLSELEKTDIKTFADIVRFNIKNSGTEGAVPGDHPAFPTGQDIFEKILAHKGTRDQDYYDALEYTRKTTRAEGIDAALKHVTVDGKTVELDGLILCDRRLVGQQLAAQAGYPTVTLPIGVDEDGLPVGITIQHKAWEEGTLIKWASAIEHLRDHTIGSRPLPAYHDHLAKNIPIGRKPAPGIYSESEVRWDPVAPGVSP